ncbi:substrate-binding periplasmic protein [Marinimicrobium sp. C2-29]|uniref:substrate-binding periplasmic protein n=1 Tax=Marinimicrobium sp. C2-29 TaxID=3139825 RepID=UPI0031387696
MKKIGFTIFTLLAACLALPVHAEEKQELVFTTIEDVPATGVAVRILARAYGRIGRQFSTLKVPSNRALMMANSGTVDGDLFRIGDIEDDYPNLIKVPTPLLLGTLHAVTLNPDLGQWNKEQLGSMRIGVRRGVLVAEMAAEGMNVILVDRYEQILRLLESGRIEVGLISDIEGSSPIHSQSWSHVRILEEPVRYFTLHHYLNHKHSDLVQPLSRALQQLHNSGETADIN